MRVSELERVHDAEPVREGPSWEDLVSEYSEGAQAEFVGQLRQARVFALVARHYGRVSLTEFAKEVGCSKSKAYDWARVWWVFGHALGDSARLENSPLTISHYVEASYAPDPMRMIEAAEDEGLTTRQIEARRKEPEVPEAPRNVETVEVVACPKCGEVYPLREAETRTEVV